MILPFYFLSRCTLSSAGTADTAVSYPPFPMPTFFFPRLLHGTDILYVLVFVITTSALGKLGEMNL